MNAGQCTWRRGLVCRTHPRLACYPPPSPQPSAQLESLRSAAHARWSKDAQSRRSCSERRNVRAGAAVELPPRRGADIRASIPVACCDQGSKWNCALRRFRFELADRVVAIGALMDMQLAAMQIDILPA